MTVLRNKTTVMDFSYFLGVVFCLSIGVLVQVNAHSWLACTDYAEKNGGTWKPEKCRGFARAGHRKAPKNGVFGHDSGFDYIPNEKNPCQVARNDIGEYTQSHPMAVYYPGQQVILVHPMKNHGADVGCTNVHIPDTGSWIYRSQRDAFRDPSLSEFRRNLVFDLGRSKTGKDFNGDLSLSSVYPKPGYQNAPRFCENTDKAMATYAFNIPRNLQPGHYTFLWLWAFNSENNLYSSCFEVDIARNKAERDQKLRRNGFADTYEPCGGTTSNPNIKGSWNGGCTVPTKPEIAETSALPTTIPFWLRSQPSTTTPFWQRWQTRATTRETTPTTTTTTTTSAYDNYYYEYNNEYDRNYQEYYGQQEENNERKDISSVESDIELAMTLLQFSGEIQLPAPRSTAVRRYYDIDFACDVEFASFWNCDIVNEDEILAPNSPRRHYEVIQEGEKQLQNLRIFYHVNHKDPCDISRFPPTAKIVREEYKNI